MRDKTPHNARAGDPSSSSGRRPSTRRGSPSPKPEKGSPAYSNSTKRRLAIQQPEKKDAPAEHGANCCCLYCRSVGR